MTNGVFIVEAKPDASGNLLEKAIQSFPYWCRAAESAFHELCTAGRAVYAYGRHGDNIHDIAQSDRYANLVAACCRD